MTHSSSSVRLLASSLVCLHLAWTFPAFAAAPAGADPGSVAIVSSVSGEALVRHAEDPNQPNPASFKGPVVYGDRITTSKDATLGLLLGEKSLLTVLELSSVEIKQAGAGVRLVEMVNGKVCLATAKIKAGTSESTVVRTPSTTVTAQPGSLFQIEVQQGTAGAARETGPDPVEPTPAARPYLASLTAQAGPKAAQAGSTPGTATIETFTVIEGSIDIVSQAAGAAATPVRVQAGRAVRVVNGKIGEPFEAPAVTCRVQDVQQAPVHTAIPGGARDTITQRETEQAEILMAMVDRPPKPTGPLDEQIKVPGGLVLPTTRLYAFGGPAVPPPVLPPPPAPVLVFQGSLVDMSIPLVKVTDPPNTTTGPATLFDLNGFKGNNANIPIGFVGLNIFNLNEYRNPDNSQILQGSIQVRSTSGVDVPIVHGVSFTNSTVAPAPGYTGPVVQIEDSKVTAFTAAQPGILVRLAASQLTANDFLQHQNTNPANTTTLNGTLLQAEQGSQVTVNGMFANVDPSTIIVNGSLLVLTGGSTLTTTGPFIDLTNSTLTGNTSPLVTVNGGTLNLGSAGNPAGLARLTNSTLTANAGLLSVSAGSVNSTGTFITMLGTSTVNGTGNLISVGTGGTLNLGSGSMFGGTGNVTVTGDVVNITGTGALTNSGAAGPVFTFGAGPTVTTGGALLNMTGNGTATLGSPLLQLAGGATVAGAALIQVAGGTVTDTAALVNVTGTTTLNRPVLNLTGGTLTPLNLTTMNANLTLNTSLMTQSGGALNTTGDALVVGGQTLTSGATPLFNPTGGTFATTGNLLNVSGGSVTLAGPLVTATIPVTVGGNLINLTNNSTFSSQENVLAPTPVITAPSLTINNGGVLNSQGGTVGIGGMLVSVTGNLNAGGPLINLTSTLGFGTFLNVSTVTTAALSPVISVGGNLIVNSGGLNNGGLLDATGSTITSQSTFATLASIGPAGPLDSALVGIHGGSTVTFTSGLIALNASSLNVNNGNPLVAVSGVGTTLSVAGDLLKLRNGSTLANFGPGQDLLSVAPVSTATIGGNLLTLDNQIFPARSAFLFAATDDPEANTTVTIGGAVASLSNGSVLTITNSGLVNIVNTNNVGRTPSLGSFASLQSGSTLSVQGDLVNISNSTVNLTGSGPAVTVNGATLNVIAIGAIASHLVNLSSNSTLTAPRGLLALTGSATATISGILASVPGGSTLSSTDTLVTTNASTLNVNTALSAISVGSITVVGSNASLAIANGGLLSSSGGTVNLTNGLTGVFGGAGANGAGQAGGNASLTTGAGLILLTNGVTLNNADVIVTGGSGGSNLNASGGAGGSASVNVTGGPALTVSGGASYAIVDDMFDVQGGAGGDGSAAGGRGGNATFTASTTVAVVNSGGLINNTDGQLLQVRALDGGSSTSGTGGSGGNAAANLGGGLLSVNAGTVTIVGELTRIQGGSGASGGPAGAAGNGGNASLTAGATLVTLSNGSVLNSHGITVIGGSGGINPTSGLPGAGNLTVNGGILNADASRLAITNNFVTVNGNLTASGVLVNLSNMTGTNPASFTDHLISISNPTATFCTTPPCSRAPGVLQATDVGTVANPIVITGSALRLDQALFEATAPLINLIRSHLQASSLVTLANNASFLSSNAAIDFVSLNASSINATGALVNLAGGTFNVAGNLVSLANGSTLTANTLAFLTGGSFNVGGALVALSGIGNTLTINANCGGGCTTFGVNVPILFQNGATLGNTTVNIPATYNAFSGPTAGNTLPGLTKPLLIVDGPTAKNLKLGP